MQSSYGVITGSLHGETQKYPRGEKTSLTWTRNKTSEESNVKSEETFLSSVENLFFSHTYWRILTWRRLKSMTVFIIGNEGLFRLLPCKCERSPTSDEQSVGLLIVTALRDYYLVRSLSRLVYWYARCLAAS